MQPVEFPPWYDLRPIQKARLTTIVTLERQGWLRLRGNMRELRAMQWVASHKSHKSVQGQGKALRLRGMLAEAMTRRPVEGSKPGDATLFAVRL